MMTIEMTKVKKRVDGAAVGGKAHYLASKNGDLFQVSAAHERWDGTVPSAEPCRGTGSRTPSLCAAPSRPPSRVRRCSSGSRKVVCLRGAQHGEKFQAPERRV